MGQRFQKWKKKKNNNSDFKLLCLMKDKVVKERGGRGSRNLLKCGWSPISPMNFLPVNIWLLTNLINAIYCAVITKVKFNHV